MAKDVIPLAQMAVMALASNQQLLEFSLHVPHQLAGFDTQYEKGKRVAFIHQDFQQTKNKSS